MNKAIQKYKCPVCGYSIKSNNFWTEKDEGKGNVKIVFFCPSCKSELTVSPNANKYISIFVGYLVFVIFIGFVSSFFVEESMHITKYMLFAFLPLIPMLFLIIRNNKAILNT